MKYSDHENRQRNARHQWQKRRQKKDIRETYARRDHRHRNYALRDQREDQQEHEHHA